MRRVAGCLAPLVLLVAGCVGAFMFDATGARGSSHPFPTVRTTELSPSDIAGGCTLRDWYPTAHGTPTYELWVVLDPGGKETGVNAGGLMELRCTNPTFLAVTRYCASASKPVTGGVYDKKTGELIACKR